MLRTTGLTVLPLAEPQTSHLWVEKRRFGRLRVEGSTFILHLDFGRCGGNGSGIHCEWRGVAKERLLQIVPVTFQVSILRRVSLFNPQLREHEEVQICLLYTSDAADE